MSKIVNELRHQTNHLEINKNYLTFNPKEILKTLQRKYNKQNKNSLGLCNIAKLCNILTLCDTL